MADKSILRRLYDGLPWRQPARLTDDQILESHLSDNGGLLPRQETPGIPDTSGREYGVSGTENYGGYLRGNDYNPQLDDIIEASKTYDKMRKGDAQVRAMLSVIKLPLRGAKWLAMAPEDGDPVDDAIATFCNETIFDDDAMDHSFDYCLRHVLLQLDFGASVLEQVYRVDDSGAYRLSKLAPRLPKTIRQWHVDRTGRLLAITQYAPVPVTTTYKVGAQSATALVAGQSARVFATPALTADARQYGTSVSYQYLCLGIHERILTADLRWVPVGEMKAGDRILSFDESPTVGQDATQGRRHWQFGEVTHSSSATADCVKVHLSDGTSVVCTTDHPWLVDPDGLGGHKTKWVLAKDLMAGGRGKYGPRRGHYVMRGLRPWETLETHQSGWLAGIFDGEGTVNQGRGLSVSMGQVNGPIQDKVVDALESFWFETSVLEDPSRESDGRQAFSNVRIVGGFHEQLRFLGSIRPSRLIQDFQNGWTPKLLRTIERVQVVHVEFIGLQEIQSLSTSTRTYVGEGFLMHNTIPADVLAVFTFDREGDHFSGQSILRTVVRNWWGKDQAYRIENVRLDRFGVGVPVASLQDGHTLNPDQLGKLKEVLKKYRANEVSHLIAPPFVSYDLMPKVGSATAGTGALEWINHNDQQIARNVLAGFLTMGNDPHGTLGFGSRLTDMFVSSLNGVAAGVCADFKHQIVRKMCNLNFDMANRKYPRVVCRDLEQVDLDNLIQTLATLQGTFINPDDDIESLLRKLLKLPAMKHSDMRETRKKDAAQSAERGGTTGAEATPGQARPPKPRTTRPDVPAALVGTKGMSDAPEQPAFNLSDYPLHK